MVNHYVQNYSPQRPDQINHFYAKKVNHLEEYQSGCDSHQVVDLEPGSVLQINEKGNLANWYPNIEIFKLCFKIFNKNEVW